MSSNVKGFKNDADKPMIALVEPDFIIGIAHVATHGYKKYGLDNWKRNLERVRILSALERHILAYAKGERFDKDSGLSHLYHAAWGLMALDYYDIRDNVSDTRPVPNDTKATDSFVLSEKDLFSKRDAERGQK
jgi:hypothetical protein